MRSLKGIAISNNSLKFVKCRRTSVVDLLKVMEKFAEVRFSLLLSLQLREPTFPNASSAQYKGQCKY